MEYNFNTIFFPTIQWIGIFFMGLALIVIMIIVSLIIKDRTRNNFKLWGLVVILMIIGITINSRTKYAIKDYVENKGYTIVIAELGLSEPIYKQVDYKDYWESMNWYTYRLDNARKTIYMRRIKFC